MTCQVLSLATIITPAHLEDGLKWAKKQRAHYPDSDEIWTLSLSLNWSRERSLMLQSVLNGTHVFEPVRVRRHDNGGVSYLWHARDAVLLKAIALGLSDKLSPSISKQCTHIKGNGSIPRAVQSAHDASKFYEYVFKSDVKSYYESINHHILLTQFTHLGADAKFLEFLRKFLEHTEQYGGLYTTITQGISKACPLSPLLGAIYLTPLDDAMAGLPIKYIRYMDDWLIFSKTKGILRKAIKLTNKILTQLKLIKHPDKTFIGRLSRTFEFCGFRFSTNGAVGLAKTTLENYTRTQSKLYEHKKEANGEQKKHQANFFAWLRGVLGTTMFSEFFVWPCRLVATQYCESGSLEPGNNKNGGLIDETLQTNNITDIAST